MTSIADGSVIIQTSAESALSTPSWFGEVAAFAQVLTHEGMLKTIQDQVRFTRARFGQYDVIDFVVVLIGYMLSGEPTRLSFYERLAPFAELFMALFGRNRLPHRSTLSRFLAALDQPTVEALRALFQKDLPARSPFPSSGGLLGRTGTEFLVVDVDGTRQAAQQRALPQAGTLPLPHRRFDQVCAPGYQGRKRGEVVRTRTVILQAHTRQFLGTFGAAGNGDYRGELRRAIGVITSYATHLRLSPASMLVRLDGLYGDAAPLMDVLSAGLGVVARSRAYHLLDLEAVKQVLTHAPDQVSTHPESGMARTLYDCPTIPLMSAGPEVRVVIATHDASSSAPAVGVERDGTVYELLVSTLPCTAFTASDVLDLYLHRGSFEAVLADEDDEQDADRWYSHTPCGQEFAQNLAQCKPRQDLGNKYVQDCLQKALRPSSPSPGSCKQSMCVRPRIRGKIAHSDRFFHVSWASHQWASLDPFLLEPLITFAGRPPPPRLPPLLVPEKSTHELLPTNALAVAMPDCQEFANCEVVHRTNTLIAVIVPVENFPLPLLYLSNFC